MKENKICFYTHVNENYYHFVLPFIFSALKNTDAHVFITVDNIKQFYDSYGKKLANLQEILGIEIFNRFNLNISTFSGVIPHTIRFLRCFIGVYDYTYITDIDILMSKDKYNKAIENNIEGMERNKTCFFNFVRKDQLKLSGVHFVYNKSYYPKLSGFLQKFRKEHENFERDINALGDEGFLYKFVKETFGEPEKLTEGNERILPGDHVSPNRGKKYPHIKQELMKDLQWEKAFKQFDKKFIDLMS